LTLEDGARIELLGTVYTLLENLVVVEPDAKTNSGTTLDIGTIVINAETLRIIGKASHPHKSYLIIDMGCVWTSNHTLLLCSSQT